MKKGRGKRTNSAEIERDSRSFVRGAESVGLNVTRDLSVEGPQSETSGTAKDADLVLELGAGTSRLVVSR